MEPFGNTDQHEKKKMFSQVEFANYIRPIMASATLLKTVKM